MDKSFYTGHQLKLFAEDLPRVLLDAGFDILEEPYIDYGLLGFRATYVRRYLLNQPTRVNECMLTTIIHVAGLPFGQHGQKMVIIATPRNLDNELVCETIKLRVHFDEDGKPHVAHHSEQHPPDQHPSASAGHENDESSGQLEKTTASTGITEHQEFFGFRAWSRDTRFKCYQDLAKYVRHIIEAISPGLIQLPIDMKLEILKKLSIESILKMSQVNSEFRQLIFKRGESLWRHLCHRDFGITIINRLVHKSWIELYRDTYLLCQAEICRKERALPGLPERLALPPVPFRHPIEWPIEVLELPFYPINGEVLALPGNPMLALEFHPIRRAASLDSLHQ